MNRFLAALALAAASAAALSACAPASPSAPPPAPCAPGAVAVGEGTDALQAALDAAVPGAVLQLSSAVYVGHFRATASGTSEAPIVLCGSDGTVLDGGDVSDGYTLHLDGVAFWDVRDLTVRGGQKGVVLDSTTHSVLTSLTISDVGQEGLHLRAGSTDNAVRSVTVERTGLVDPEFGEGVYVGSAESNWCRYSACEPDRSDRNVFDGLVVRDTTAEALDVKEGTTAGVVRGSSLSTGASPAVDSAVDLKGSEWRVEGSTVQGPVDAISIHVILPPWGSRNVVASSVLRPGPGGFGVTLVGAARAAGNTVACDNSVEAGASLADVACT
ncbi:hypothetical protein [Microbacterium sp. 5K110]|jgi:hypothetical protein|uniref:hypothetical protein n=1 Tax=unclassified Microbacterium TaxID=2609290 RepID=UPI0010FD0D2D|nr:hypothetical protein [Microbacterium sp. 5K110]TLF27103.1 hypothetical protein FE256_16030 [Microbacterium sp. 5K110]